MSTDVAASIKARIQEARPRRFRPYPEYKASGVEWLGDIPAHWECPRMWRISTAMSGGTPAKENRSYWNGDVPWVSPKDMKRRIIDSAQDAITDLALAETGLKMIAPPMVLIVVRGMILAHSFPVGVTTVPITINQDMKALTLRPGIEPSYFAHALEGLARGILATVVEEAAHGTRAIRMDEWRNVMVPVPSDVEQRVIAAFLDRETAKIDALVARKERLNELLQEKRTALITRAVTRGLDSDVTMKDSGVEWLGEIPAHWEVKRVGQLLRERPRNGMSPAIGPDGTTPTFSTAAVKDGVVAIEGNVKYTTIGSSKARAFLVLQGDVLLLRGSGSRSLVGKAGIVIDRPPEGCIYPDILIRVRPGQGLAPWFLVKCLNSTAVRPQIEAAARTAAGIWKITGEDIRCLIIPVPPHPEQRRLQTEISRILSKIAAAIAKINEGVDYLKEFRTALISAAVTGKIDVREETS